MTRIRYPLIRVLELATITVTCWALETCAAVPLAAAQQVSVPGASNIFGAGHEVPPAPGGGGAGLLPVMIPIPSHQPEETQIVQFQSVTGEISPCCPGGPWNGPDGAQYEYGTDIYSCGGISGMIDADGMMFLAGVFVTDAEPSDPAPPRLDFSSAQIGTNFLGLSPVLDQTFFIGDGHADQTLQTFHVPEGATRLFLGVLDAQDFMCWPGYYDDNYGEFLVAYSVSALGPTPTGTSTWSKIKVLYR